ncbi:hypothetical protein MM_0683 [Methanosarcina mazei Go1]|uniref:Uncharacterized protein n=1 Tax=Methanosarcina mazei (strain ATCC BAA-159 / DSM 3647 / Goe1 / Go1 / JCM 11833 / OCM 88) TaxID=192952 RepID=Q8PZ12_METMA|nr:hypothetical protein MM_0683 [Methanosarcina mazei Go1]
MLAGSRPESGLVRIWSDRFRVWGFYTSIRVSYTEFNYGVVYDSFFRIRTFYLSAYLSESVPHPCLDNILVSGRHSYI